MSDNFNHLISHVSSLPFDYLVVGLLNGLKLGDSEKYPSITVGSISLNVRTTTELPPKLVVGAVVACLVTSQIGNNGKVYPSLSSVTIL